MSTLPKPKLVPIKEVQKVTWRLARGRDFKAPADWTYLLEVADALETTLHTFRGAVMFFMAETLNHLTKEVNHE